MAVWTIFGACFYFFNVYSSFTQYRDADQHDSDSNSESGDPEDYGDGIDKKKDPEDHVYYTSSGRKTNSLAKLKDAF